MFASLNVYLKNRFCGQVSWESERNRKPELAPMYDAVSGYELLFHSCAMPKMEIDFLIRKGIKICPVEAKSSACRQHASLDALIRKYPSRLGEKYVVCAEDYHVDNGIVYLPFYMTHCL